MTNLINTLQNFVATNKQVVNDILFTYYDSGIFEDSLTANDISKLEKLNLYNDIVNCEFTQDSLRAQLAKANVTLDVFNVKDELIAIANKFNVTYDDVIAQLKTIVYAE